MNFYKLEYDKYQKAYLPIVPLKGKIPDGIKWQSKNWLDPNTARGYLNGKSYNLGLLLGEPSGIVALDLDSTFQEENEFIEKKMREYCDPPSGKKGMKGRNWFFKWTPELEQELKKNGRKFKSINVEILSNGNQTVMPPSIHPDTNKPYVQIGEPLYELDLNSLPEFPIEFLIWLKEENNSKKKKKEIGKNPVHSFGANREGGCRHNSHNTLSSVLTARMERGESVFSTIGELIKVDKENNIDTGQTSYFLCNSRNWKSDNIEENAKWLVDDYIQRHNSENPTYSLKDYLENGLWVYDAQSQTREFFLIHKESKMIEKIAEKTLTKLFPRDRLAELSGINSKHCFFFYNPHKKQFEHREGLQCFNKFTPPNWKKDFFWLGEPVPVSAKMPEDFEKYFTHITSGNEDCKTWLIHWLANSLQGRNKNALLLISETRGTGKTLLYEIMSRVHGDSNSYLSKDGVLKERFTGQVRNKTLVCIDEIYLKTPEAFNNLKAWTNDNMAFEDKGIIESMSANHANLIVCSNKFKAIPLHEDNRQFSVIEVPEKELTECPEFESQELIRKKLLNEENIKQLAQYLFGLKVDHNILQKPFRGQKAEEISEITRPEWHNYVLTELPQELLELEGLPCSDSSIRSENGLRFVDFKLGIVRDMVNKWINKQRPRAERYTVNKETLKHFLNSPICREIYSAKRFYPSVHQTPSKNTEIVRVFIK